MGFTLSCFGFMEGCVVMLKDKTTRKLSLFCEPKALLYFCLAFMFETKKSGHSYDAM